MVDILKYVVNTTNTFLLVFNGQSERLDTGIQQMVSMEYNTIQMIVEYVFLFLSNTIYWGWELNY